MQGLTLLFQELVRIRSCFQCIAQVRDSHQSYGVVNISFAANSERRPSRVRDPAVFFSLTFLKQSVANSSRKWDVDGSFSMHMSDLRFPKSKFFAPEPMRVNGDVRPRRNLALQLTYVVHIQIHLILHDATSMFGSRPA